MKSDQESSEQTELTPVEKQEHQPLYLKLKASYVGPPRDLDESEGILIAQIAFELPSPENDPQDASR